MSSGIKIAFNDMLSAFKNWPLWTYLAWFEVKLSYRGSMLGPFWITASMAIFVAALSVVYAKLFHQNVKEYLPFLICGFVNWYLISSLTTKSCTVFISNSDFITQINMPYFVYVLKHIVKELIIFAHNFLVYIAILVIFRIDPGWKILLAIPGMALVILNLAWLTVLLGMLASRFRDIPQVVSSAVQVVFFISPITWMPKLVGKQSIIIKLNPITYMMDVLREPLLGVMPPWYSWVILIVIFLVGTAITLPFFATYRKRIPFWVL